MTETGPAVTTVRLREEISLSFGYIILPSCMREKHTCSKLTMTEQKLDSRIKRIRGQVDSIERSLTTCDDCAGVLMLLAKPVRCHRSGRRPGDQFAVYVCDRLVLSSLTPVQVE
jgi:hypothetical protein